MTSSTLSLAGTCRFKPLRQGDHSNLCGLYSVVNAIQLANWRMPNEPDELRELLSAGIRHLTRRRALARVMTTGMDQDLWIELSAELITTTNKLFGTSLELAPLPVPKGGSTEKVISRIRDAITNACPVLCGIGGALDHYTVVSGITDSRIVLFDSSGFRWIEQRSFGLNPGKSRHWLYDGSAWAVVDAW